MSCYDCALAKPYLACSYNHVRVIKRTIVVLESLNVYRCDCCDPNEFESKVHHDRYVELTKVNYGRGVMLVFSCACGEYGCTRGCSDSL